MLEGRKGERRKEGVAAIAISCGSAITIHRLTFPRHSGEPLERARYEKAKQMGFQVSV